MPKSHKRWVSYELMRKRVNKRPYMIMDVWRRTASNSAVYVTASFTRDLRHPITIASYRLNRAADRDWWAAIHQRVLSLAMVLHPRLGQHSLWHDLPEVLLRMITSEAYLSEGPPPTTIHRVHDIR
jgi:hypothetical protein